MTVESDAKPRLSRDKTLQAAVALADQQGIEAVTMRNLASELGVEAMSLYYHVANKDELLAGMVEMVMDEVNSSVEDLDGGQWKTTLRNRILAARQVLLAHPWTPSLIETRATMTPSVLTYFEATLGLLRSGGFSYDLAHHSLHALGSRALGFSQELFQPDNQPAGQPAGDTLGTMADRFPNLVGMVAAVSHDDPDSTLGWCDDQTEFEFGLDLILDGLERMLEE